MLRFLLIAIFSFGLFSAATSASAACAKPKFAKKYHVAVPAKKIDQALFSAAQVAATNYYRCRAGLPELKMDRTLVKSATSHSVSMAKRTELSHRVRGEASMKTRYRKAGVSTRIFMENILLNSRMQVGRNMFIERDRATCHYVFAGNKKKVPAHTYASLALKSAQLFYDSPSHRKNMLDRRVSRLGSATALSTKSTQPCGAFFVTQNFAS